MKGEEKMTKEKAAEMERQKEEGNKVIREEDEKKYGQEDAWGVGGKLWFSNNFISVIY